MRIPKRAGLEPWLEILFILGLVDGVTHAALFVSGREITRAEDALVFIMVLLWLIATRLFEIADRMADQSSNRASSARRTSA